MLKAGNYLTNKAELQQVQCTICNEVFSRMAKCKGPCQKIICLPCITKLVCGTVGKCPLRCSLPFQFQVIEVEKLLYHCPFRAQGCNFETNKQKLLKNHALICIHQSQEFKEALEKKLKYQCQKGHLLDQFSYSQYVQYFSQQIGGFFGQKCAQCAKVTFTRSICIPCTNQTKTLTFFCPECSIIPGTKTSCPHGDPLLKIDLTEQYGYHWVCDFCGLAALINGKDAYFEPNCNFGFCQDCYLQVKETHDLIPMEWSPNLQKVNLQN